MSKTVWLRVSFSVFYSKQVGETRESRARRTRSCHDGYAQGDVSLKSFLGLCEETLQVTHSDCQNVKTFIYFFNHIIKTICPTSFFFSLYENEKPESYPFSTVNPQSKKGYYFSFYFLFYASMRMR